MWICDVNGVLIDSTAVVRAAFAATAARYGLSFDEADFRRVKGFPVIEAYRRLDPAGHAPARCAFHLAYVREHIKEIRAFQHVPEVLAAAKAAGVRIGAATSHGETAEACLVNNGLYQFIDCLVTQEEVKRSKPFPDAILRVLTLLGVQAESRDIAAALCVGDAVVDIEAGKAAGVRTIGVTYGVSSPAEIIGAEPDDTIHSFLEMRRFLRLPTPKYSPWRSRSSLSHLDGRVGVKP